MSPRGIPPSIHGSDLFWNIPLTVSQVQFFHTSLGMTGGRMDYRWAAVEWAQEFRPQLGLASASSLRVAA